MKPIGNTRRRFAGLDPLRPRAELLMLLLALVYCCLIGFLLMNGMRLIGAALGLE